MFRQEWKNTGTQGRNTYVVALCCGGIMEDPDIHYENHQIIRADSKREAEDKYNKLNNCSYYYGHVVETLHEDLTVIPDECGRAVVFVDRRQRPLADPMSHDIGRELQIIEKYIAGK